MSSRKAQREACKYKNSNTFPLSPFKFWIFSKQKNQNLSNSWYFREKENGPAFGRCHIGLRNTERERCTTFFFFFSKSPLLYSRISLSLFLFLGGEEILLGIFGGGEGREGEKEGGGGEWKIESFGMRGFRKDWKENLKLKLDFVKRREFSCTRAEFDILDWNGWDG